jgi:hypothetical protein
VDGKMVNLPGRRDGSTAWNEKFESLKCDQWQHWDWVGNYSQNGSWNHLGRLLKCRSQARLKYSIHISGVRARNSHFWKASVVFLGSKIPSGIPGVWIQLDRRLGDMSEWLWVHASMCLTNCSFS